MHIKPLLPLLAAIGLFTVVNAQAVILIDNFGDNLRTTAIRGANQNNSVALSPSNSVFDQRAQLALMSNPTQGDQAQIDVFNGSSSFDAISSDSVLLRTTWSGVATGSIDFTGEDTLRFDIFGNSADIPNVTYSVKVFTDDGAGGSISAEKVLQPALGSSIIDLALFDNGWLDNSSNPVNLDWAAVIGIELEAETLINQDADFEVFFRSVSVVSTTSVPTPGSILLMSLGLVGVGAVKRRKRA